jgi:uncharacterized protein with HEPN domain
MPRSQLLCLNDISDAAENIRSYVGDLPFENFKNDRIRVEVVVRNFEVIGEAVKNLSDDLKTQFPATGWKAVAGFRDTPIHGYSGIDLSATGLLYKILHQEDNQAGKFLKNPGNLFSEHPFLHHYLEPCPVTRGPGFGNRYSCKCENLAGQG